MKVKSLLAIIAGLCLLTGCGNDMAEDSGKSDSVTTSDSQNSTESVTDDVSEEPQIKNISDTEKEFIFYRDHMKIYGKIYYPNGKEPFPLMILSSDLSKSYRDYEDYAKKFADNGIASVVCDYTGAVSPSKSDGLTVNASIKTESADLNTIIDNLSILPDIDENNIFLWGYSYGCSISAYTAAQRPKDIRALILAEPAFQLSDTLRELFPEGTEIPLLTEDPYFIGRTFVEDMFSFDLYDYMPKFNKNVLILQGTDSSSYGVQYPEYMEKAHQTFPSCILQSVEGADHNFSGNSNEKMIDETIRFIQHNIS